MPLADASRDVKRGKGMECKVRNLANVVLIEVEGRVDHGTAPAFGSALLPHVEGCTGEVKKILVDLGKVDYMSSAGLRVLMIAAKGCRKQDGKMVLAALQPTIQEVFKIGRFDMVLETFPSVRDALAAISPAAAAVYGDR
jgi:anti-anti-sigma factor